MPSGWALTNYGISLLPAIEFAAGISPLAGLIYAIAHMLFHMWIFSLEAKTNRQRQLTEKRFDERLNRLKSDRLIAY